MATIPCFESSNCIELTTKGNALIANPILEGSPPIRKWPYDCDPGANTSLHCGSQGMWADPVFCSDTGTRESSIEVSLDINDNPGTYQIGEDLVIEDEDGESPMRNDSCYPAVIVIAASFGPLTYQTGLGRVFTSNCMVTSNQLPGPEVAFKSLVNISTAFTFSPAASQGTAFHGGTKIYRFPLDSGESMSFRIWQEVNLQAVPESGEGGFPAWVPPWQAAHKPDGEDNVLGTKFSDAAWNRELIYTEKGKLRLDWFTVPNCSKPGVG